MPTFVAVDFETTGFSPDLDRVVEVGLVQFDEYGNTLAEFEQLVNPRRPIPNSRIHGIRSEDVAGCPTFPEVLPLIANFVNGSVLVMHNKTFDLSFLREELRRASLPALGLDALCTLQVMRSRYILGPRSLDACCELFGIETSAVAHRALPDARMTALLAQQLLRDSAWTTIPPAAAIGIDAIAAKHATVSPPVVLVRENTDFLAPFQLGASTSKPNDSGSGSVTAEYVELLDLALHDDVVPLERSHSLLDFAYSNGLSKQAIRSIHLDYFSVLAAAAWEDHHLSKDELSHLRRVAAYLSIGNWEELLCEASEGEYPISSPNSFVGGMRIPSYAMGMERDVADSEFLRAEGEANFQDEGVKSRLAGKSIVITGEFSEFSRAQGQQAILSRGGKAPSSVSKKTFALVVGQDPGPSKLSLASAYGTPLLNVGEFRHVLDHGELPPR